MWLLWSVSVGRSSASNAKMMITVHVHVRKEWNGCRWWWNRKQMQNGCLWIQKYVRGVTRLLKGQQVVTIWRACVGRVFVTCAASLGNPTTKITLNAIFSKRRTMEPLTNKKLFWRKWIFMQKSISMLTEMVFNSRKLTPLRKENSYLKCLISLWVTLILLIRLISLLLNAAKVSSGSMSTATWSNIKVNKRNRP